MTLSSIRKRDGRVVTFDQNKITVVVQKAFAATGVKDEGLSQVISDDAVRLLQERFIDKIPHVEDTQDAVERALVKNNLFDAAKAFIIYRNKRTEIRSSQDPYYLDVRNTINDYLNLQSEWAIKENSNVGYSFSGLVKYTSNKIISNYVLNEIYPQPVRDAHREGKIHLHDLYCGLVGYCAGWSLKNLILRGFGNVPNKLNCKPPKHLGALANQMVNFLCTVQMEFAGAQAYSSVDTLMAPFVAADNLTFAEVKQEVQGIVYNLNVPSRWGSETPFTNFSFDWKVPPDLKDEKAFIGGKQIDATYGEFQREMNMINRAFLEVYKEGDASKRPFTFPIPTYNITREFDWDDPNTNLLFQMAAKYGTPYFQNYIGSGLDPRAIRAMCCRLNLDQRQLMKRPGSMWNIGDSTGSIGVVSINMNRIGYEAKDETEYFEMLRNLMILARDSLEIKRKILGENMKKGLMPYAKVYLGSFDNYFATMGPCGMNESLLNFMQQDISTPDGLNFTKKVLNFMRSTLAEFQAETQNLYNLEATPAESTAYRFATLDKKKYPDIITAGDETPYLTNSTWLPVGFTDSIIEAAQHQSEIQPMYTGGTVFHGFIGEEMKDAEATKKLVKKLAEKTPLPYFNITPTFSICHAHGYIPGKVEHCPTCGARMEIYSRIVGYFRPVQVWNRGKQAEFKDRKAYDVEKGQRTAAVSPPLALQ